MKVCRMRQRADVEVGPLKSGLLFSYMQNFCALQTRLRRPSRTTELDTMDFKPFLTLQHFRPQGFAGDVLAPGASYNQTWNTMASKFNGSGGNRVETGKVLEAVLCPLYSKLLTGPSQQERRPK